MVTNGWLTGFSERKLGEQLILIFDQFYKLQWGGFWPFSASLSLFIELVIWLRISHKSVHFNSILDTYTYFYYFWQKHDCIILHRSTIIIIKWQLTLSEFNQHGLWCYLIVRYLDEKKYWTALKQNTYVHKERRKKCCWFCFILYFIVDYNSCIYELFPILYVHVIGTLILTIYINSCSI